MRSAWIRFAVAACAAVVSLYSGCIVAQSWPQKPVRLIVPYPAGGLTDVLARGLAMEIGKLWGQPLLVDNRPGASTIIAADALARSAPDGYTLGMLDKTAIALNPFLFSKLPYDPQKDFAPVVNMVQNSNVLVVNADLGIGSMQELIALARAKPGSINYGSFGLGSVVHLDTEALAALAGVRFTHIPYKGIAETLPAVASGQIQFTLSGIPPAMPLLRQGRLKAIAITSRERVAQIADVPTFVEAGINLVSESWFGLLVPAPTPRNIVDRIAADVGRVITQREFGERFITGVGLKLINDGPEKMAATMAADRSRYQQIIRNANLKLD